MFPPSLSGVDLVFYVSMLLKYYEDNSRALDFNTMHVDENLAYEEAPMAIFDR